ncbi:MAG TPA: chain length-determining protein [Deltaproteobacteria bacterium]|nr:MAG: hypothetical protein A2Z79_09035 [Deltaproteobacteria bacterium GWA2_55_82]OGQ64610.1 MAG: hypothetical protein A3I81_11300 [Deltaproteobacteria bacterium RIFCSPLOWO2_02_FULL_55_12]OIJ73708.1 MAG: hypothetical protein A2V21_305170 [Deltaproteobacteria bacterium GWC2_55_46]HBG45898.1 chain length-determining protein [Deltaproteobacteria bacterium]HCY09683.1 chain length-determining protein [Deltaproteobacteria bacterium]
MERDSGLDIRKYAQLVIRNRYLFLAVVLVISAGSVVLSYALPKAYEAKSTVFIEKNVINELIKDIAVTPSMQDRLRVLSYAISSRNILTKVVNTLGVDVKDDRQVESLVKDLQNRTMVNMKDMDLFVVSFKDADPKFASDYVNTLVRMYIEENISSKREEAYGANRFLSEQISFFKAKLDEVEGEVIKFRKEKGVFVAVNETAVVSDIKGVQDGLDAIKIQKRELEARREVIKKQLGQEKPYTVALMSRDSLQERLISLQKRLRELMMTYTKDYPEVMRTQVEMESFKEMLKNRKEGEPYDSGAADTELSTINPVYHQLKDEYNKTERELAAVAAKEEHMRRLVGSKESYLRNIPAEKTKLSELEMERNTYRSIYEDLVAKLGQSEVSKQMEVQDKTATFRIVDPAMVSARPVSPNRVQIILLGLLLGIAGGVGAVIALDYLSASAKRPDDLSQFNVPVLAVIPVIRNPADAVVRKRRDMLAFSIAGAYAVVLIAILVFEATDLGAYIGKL